MRDCTDVLYVQGRYIIGSVSLPEPLRGKGMCAYYFAILGTDRYDRVPDPCVEADGLSLS